MEAIGQSEEYFEGAIFTADSNYHDPTNLKKCEEEKFFLISRNLGNPQPLGSIVCCLLPNATQIL